VLPERRSVVAPYGMREFERMSIEEFVFMSMSLRKLKVALARFLRT
jgi:hypothetical protein